MKTFIKKYVIRQIFSRLYFCANHPDDFEIDNIKHKFIDMGRFYDYAKPPFMFLTFDSDKAALMFMQNEVQCSEPVEIVMIYLSEVQFHRIESLYFELSSTVKNH